MSLRALWLKYKDRIYVLIVIGIITIYSYWYLSLNPQYVSSFWVAPTIALILVALLAFMPEIRKRLVNGILAYHNRQKEMKGWPYRYQKTALLLFFIIILTLPLLAQYQFIPSQYMPWVVLAFFILILGLGAIQIVTLIRGAGKWGLFLIAILTLIAILRILIWRLSKSP